MSPSPAPAVPRPPLRVALAGIGVVGGGVVKLLEANRELVAANTAKTAFLAAMIPSPLNVFNPAKNRKRVVRRQRVILRGMNSIKLAYSEK